MRTGLDGRRVRWALAAATLIALRLLFPPRGLDAVGIIAIRDLILTLILWLLFLAISTAVGLRIIVYSSLPGLTSLEKLIYGFALGAGALAYSLLGLGLIGSLSTGAVVAILTALSWWLAPGLSRLTRISLKLPSSVYRLWQTATASGKVAGLVAVAIGALVFVNALSPPWAYDGLMYHLAGPKLFLEADRVFPYPDNWYVNGPFAIQMLFTIGMTFGDDVFPKLVHFSMGLLYIGATYVVARRWFSQKVALLSVAILLTVPTLPVWGSFAYIDLGWSAYEILGLGALLVWWRERGQGWLVLSGTMIGLAAGSKYLGLMGLAVLGAFLLLSTRELDWRQRLRVGLLFGIPAVIVAAPWYLKNMVWFGNPIYPLVFGGPGWDAERVGLYSAYLNSFGVGRGVVDYLLLPWNVYAQHERFGAVMNRIDVPSVLFPLAILVAWKWRNPIVRALVVIVGARFLLWSLGSQQIRFLLPIYPALAIGTAYVIARPARSGSTSVRWPLFLQFLTIGLMLITLFYQLQIVLQVGPIRAISGAESRKSFFLRNVLDYPALLYAQENLGQFDRVLMLGDGRGYLCLPVCVPDPDHFRWANEISRLSDGNGLGQLLADLGISHVLLSWEDLDFLLQHDPEGVMERAAKTLIAWRDVGCLEPVFADQWTELYYVSCGR